jgi:hypothetical protein
VLEFGFASSCPILFSRKQPQIAHEKTLKVPDLFAQPFVGQHFGARINVMMGCGAGVSPDPNRANHVGVAFFHQTCIYSVWL